MIWTTASRFLIKVNKMEMKGGKCYYPKYTRWIYVSMIFLFLVFTIEIYFVVAHLLHDQKCAEEIKEMERIEQNYVDEHHPDKYINKTE